MQFGTKAILACLLLALHTGGCSQAPDGPTPFDDNGATDGIETDLSDPSAVIAAHDLAWNERKRAAYDALLDTEFEIVLLEQGDEFPWLEEHTFEWFDPGHWDEPASTGLVELSSVPQAFQAHDEMIDVPCRLFGRVMWTLTDGATIEGRFTFELVRRGEFLRIRRIVQLP